MIELEDHMVISYLAQLPEPRSYRLMQAETVRRPDPDGTLGERMAPGQFGPYLLGRLTERKKDVCAEYYRSRRRRPLYSALAECPEDFGSIMAFTTTWGYLGERHPIPKGWRELVGKPDCPWRGDQSDFLMDLTGWVILKRRFMLWLAAAEQPRNRRDVLKLMDTESWHAFDAGQLNFGMVLQNREWIPQVRPHSLYMAFVAMLWLDIAAKDRMLLRCADPECGRFFITDRRDKKYCDSECALRVARRSWWRAHGSQWRRKRKSRG